MTRNTPSLPLSRAFVPAQTPSFADLITHLKDTAKLSPSRKRDMISGLNRVAKALGLPPSDVPCDGRWLQPRLSQVRPQLIGLKPKSWQNAVSDARMAMVEVGIVERRANRITDLDKHWRPLWEAVLALSDPTLPTALRRFTHFLNRLGVSPEDVTDTHATAYLEALATNEISKDPNWAYRAAVNGWNLAADRIPAWPKHRLSLPSRRKRIKLDSAAFPKLFVEEVEALLDGLANPDPFSPTAPGQPRSPATIRQYRVQLLRFASHLVASGMPPSDIHCLSVLIDPAIAKRGLKQMLSHTDGRTSRDISGTASLLRNVARLLDAPEEIREAMAQLAQKVALPIQNGMTPRNRERLRVLQTPEHTRRLLLLPDHIFKTHTKPSRAKANALAFEDAVAIAILLVCPVRVGSLARITLDQHIQRPGDGRVFLVLEEADTKTNRSIEFELPADVVALLDRFLAIRTPHLCPPGTRFLFPQRDGNRPVDPNALSSRIAKRIRKETGLCVNAHLFRHFAVMTWLDANPGGYEVARRLLGHSDLSHTINMYSGLEVTSATKAFSDLVEDLRKNST